MKKRVMATELEEIPGSDKHVTLSVITPAYNEERNLPVLYETLSQVLSSFDGNWEWIVVDDHSADKTFDTITGIALGDPRVRAIRLARNFGSHTALACGLHH